MKTTLVSMAGILALILPAIAQIAPKPAAPPTRIRVTLQVMEVPGAAAITVGLYEPRSTWSIYNALLKSNASEVTEVSVQTPNDFPGVAEYTRLLAFTSQDHGKPNRSVMTAPTGLEATPHINPDGTITVRLKMYVTRIFPQTDLTADAVPIAESQSMTTLRTFKSGETCLLAGKVMTGHNDKAGPTLTSKEMLLFVTVTALPSEGAAQ